MLRSGPAGPKIVWKNAPKVNKINTVELAIYSGPNISNTFVGNKINIVDIGIENVKSNRVTNLYILSISIYFFLLSNSEIVGA